jgi:hypothetical protein
VQHTQTINIPNISNQRLLDFKIKLATLQLEKQETTLKQQQFDREDALQNQATSQTAFEPLPADTLEKELIQNFEESNPDTTQNDSVDQEDTQNAPINFGLTAGQYFSKSLTDPENNTQENQENKLESSFQQDPNSFFSPFASEFESQKIRDIENEILSPINKKKITLSELGQDIKHTKIRNKIKTAQKTRSYSLLGTLVASLMFVFVVSTGSFLNANNPAPRPASADGTSQISPAQQKKIDYTNWIKSKNNDQYSDPSDDLDKDGLTNFEEMITDSEPLNKNSCTSKSTDLENLVNLIDPKTCVAIDFKNDDQVQKFSQVINIPQVQKEVITKPSLEKKSLETNITSSSASSIISSSVAPSSKSVDSVSSSSNLPTQVISSSSAVEAETKSTETKAEDDYANATEKVAQYLNKYRSFDNFDSSDAVPVDASYFVKVSQEYGVPLKYVLALGRSESRFGTDRYNSDGSANRIGRHKNIYSMGLDDSGGSITYNTWEDGVDAFGKWYKRHNDKGIADCNKWRIYNPNGDYCQKVEALASGIDGFLKS